jgi:hypothetical protein
LTEDGVSVDEAPSFWLGYHLVFCNRTLVSSLIILGRACSR